MFKRLAFLLVALALMLMCTAAFAFPLGEPLTGVITYPEGASEEDALYVYRYSYPTVTGEGAAPQLINGVFDFMVEDAYSFRVPMDVEGLTGEGPQHYKNITYEITCHTEDYLSVTLHTEAFTGLSSAQSIAGYTFLLSGEDAGKVIYLPHLLGLLDIDETDDWLIERQTIKADECVRELVWEIIEEQISDGTVAYDPDLTYELFSWNFYPEVDFYMNDSGDLVFYIQEALIAPASEGVLLFPFSLEELLDEI